MLAIPRARGSPGRRARAPRSRGARSLSAGELDLRVPRQLETERLRLRQWRDDDLDAYAELMAEPTVSRFLGDGSPMSREDAWRQMAVHAGAWSLRGFSHWALELRTTGELVGRAGPWFPEGWPGLEIGWVIHPRHQGRGYATEAGREALACAWRDLAAGRVISLIRPQNLASAAVAKKLGAVLDTRIDVFFGAAIDVWAYPPPG